MRIELQVTKSDWVEFRLFHEFHRSAARLKVLAWAGLPALGAALALFGLLTSVAPGPIRFLTTGLPALLLVPLYLALFVQVKKRRFRTSLDRSLKFGQARALLGQFEAVLSEESLLVKRDGVETAYPWERSHGAIANSAYLFIYIAPSEAIVFPRRCFADNESFQLFVKTAVIYHWNKDARLAAGRARRPDEGLESKRPAEPLPPIPV